MAKPTPISGLDRDTPLAEAAESLLAARLADVRACEPRLRAKRDPDAVHDMRVAGRRLRAALALFLRDEADADREVKRLQDALGGLRDLHVQIEGLEALASSRELTALERSVVSELLGEQRAALPARARALGPALRRWSDRTAPALSARFSGLTVPGRLGGKGSRKRLQKGFRRLDRRSDEALASPDPERAHRLRIALKKLRYQAELLEAAFSDEVGALLEAVVPLQEALGGVHDLDVRARMVEELAERAAPSERAAPEVLLRRLKQERGAIVEGLVSALRELRRDPRAGRLRRRVGAD